MYFVLGKSTKPRRWMDEEPFLRGISFWKGARIDSPVPEPLQYKLKRLRRDADDHAPFMPSTLGTRIPLFRDDLIASLRACGVDNLDLYAATVSDPEDGTVHENYKAVNILGLVAVADLQASRYVTHGAPVADVDFDALVVDESKARGLLMFRLAESVNAVLVHEKVKDRLTQAGFDDLAFNIPAEIAI
jgi:hypothetical protein